MLSSVIVLAALLAITHVVLYSAVTVSTLENKPRGVYFEDNALLPGLSAPTFSAAPRRSGRTAGSATPPGRIGESPPCVQLERLGLPCWQQRATNLTWTAIRPRGIYDGKEALALVVAPPRDGGNEAACGSPMHRIAPFMSHIDEKGHLAKTLFILFPDPNGATKNSVEGAIVHWLHTFYGSSPAFFPMSGSLRAAIVLEVPAEECARTSPTLYGVQLGVVGSRGRLPNMDLVNLASNALLPENTRIEE